MSISILIAVALAAIAVWIACADRLGRAYATEADSRTLAAAWTRKVS